MGGSGGGNPPSLVSTSPNVVSFSSLRDGTVLGVKALGCPHLTVRPGTWRCAEGDLALAWHCAEGISVSPARER